VKSMNKNALINEEQTKLLIETIGKNAWSSAAPVVRVDAWSNFHQSPDSLRNYLCKDGSGYIRGLTMGQVPSWCDPTPRSALGANVDEIHTA
jgi:hypothetical protein